jgi:hypothetical protein
MVGIQLACLCQAFFHPKAALIMPSLDLPLTLNIYTHTYVTRHVWTFAYIIYIYIYYLCPTIYVQHIIYIYIYIYMRILQNILKLIHLKVSGVCIYI